MQNDDGEVAISWVDQIEFQLLDSEIEADVVLGRSTLSVEQMLELSVGDVLMLNQSQDKPLKMRIEGTEKYYVEPVERSGVIAVKVVETIEKPVAPPIKK